jgi:formimidoylglutamate deiminase
MSELETAWLPDLLLAGDRLESGLALVAGADGRVARLSRDPADLARAERLAGRVLLPGFVNAHSHAFQRAIRGRTELRSPAGRDTFWTWREKMYHAATRLSDEALLATARLCYLEMALAGITHVGEFHYLHHRPDGHRHDDDPNILAKVMIRAAQEVGLRITLLHAAYGRAGWNKPADPGQRRFLCAGTDAFLADFARLRADVGDRPAVRLGLAPHSLRAVTLAEFEQLNAYARAHRLPVHMHISEQRAENEACQGEHGATPVTLLARRDQLHAGLTAIHATHVTPAELAALGEAGVTVCACPTTERNLGDGILSVHDLLRHGVPLALGTDSQIQVAPLEDARQLEYHLRLAREERVVVDSGDGDGNPDRLALRLLRAATAGGARALQTDDGELAPGRTADFVTLDRDDPSVAGSDRLLAPLVFGAERTAIRDVVVAGRRIVRDGRHARAAEFTAGFTAAQRELWG